MRLLGFRNAPFEGLKDAQGIPRRLLYLFYRFYTDTEGKFITFARLLRFIHILYAVYANTEPQRDLKACIYYLIIIIFVRFRF